MFVFEERQQKPYPSPWIAKKREQLSFLSQVTIIWRLKFSVAKWSIWKLGYLKFYFILFIFFSFLWLLIWWKMLWMARNQKIKSLCDVFQRNKKSWCTDLNKLWCHTQKAVLQYLLQCFKSGIWKNKKQPTLTGKWTIKQH